MLDHCHVIAFVATAAPQRAKAFYRDVLGLPLVSEDPFALVFDAHGTMLRVTIVEQHTPADHTVLGWRVPDIGAAVGTLISRGVALERYSSLSQDALAIWTAPGGARVAWFKDPDGNLLSLTQFPGS